MNGRLPFSRAAHASCSVLALLAMFCGSSVWAATTQTREVAFEYEATGRIPIKTIQQPADSKLCLVTAREVDAYGNATKNTVRNCSGAAGANAPLNSEAPKPATGDPALFADRISTIEYADPRFPSKAIDAEGQTQTFTYNAAFGVQTSATDPNNLATQWTLDAFGRKVFEVRPDGTAIQWSYKYCTTVPGGTESCPVVGGVSAVYVVTMTPVVAATKVQIGAWTKLYADGMDRTIRTETQGFDGSGASTPIYEDTEYNLRGLPSRKSRPYYAGSQAYWTQFVYDAKDRLARQVAPDGGVTTIAFSGLITTTTDPLGHSTTVTNDPQGHVAAVRDHHGFTARYAYDPFGNLVAVTDAKGNITGANFDARGRRTRLVDPDLGVESYTYNAAGDLIVEANARGDTTSRTVDRLGRVTASQSAAFSGAWYYGQYANGAACANGKARLCEMVSGNGSHTRRTYDAYGRVATVTETIDRDYVAAFGYDATTGRPDTVTYPITGLKVRTAYTPLGYPAKLTDVSSGKVYWQANARDAEGHVTQQVFANGVATASTFDPATGYLSSRTAGTNNAVQHLGLSFDPVGNLSTRDDLVTGVVAAFSYDGLNRLLSETRSGAALPTAQTVSWSYDEIGNIKNRSDVGRYTYAASGAGSLRPHAVDNISGTVNGVTNPTYRYDAQGNLVNGGGRALQWSSHDSWVLPTEISKGSSTLAFW